MRENIEPSPPFFFTSTHDSTRMAKKYHFLKRWAPIISDVATSKNNGNKMDHSLSWEWKITAKLKKKTQVEHAVALVKLPITFFGVPSIESVSWPFLKKETRPAREEIMQNKKKGKEIEFSPKNFLYVHVSWNEEKWTWHWWRDLRSACLQRNSCLPLVGDWIENQSSFQEKKEKMKEIFLTFLLPKYQQQQQQHPTKPLTLLEPPNPSIDASE